jgi:hypothetical protein
MRVRTWKGKEKKEKERPRKNMIGRRDGVRRSKGKTRRKRMNERIAKI